MAAERMPEVAPLPSRQEINVIATRALELIGERSTDSLGHGPGYMSTATAEYCPSYNTRVRLSTLQDWDGNAKTPDMSVTIDEMYGDEDEGCRSAVETEYTFYASSNIVMPPSYSVLTDLAEVVIGPDGRTVSRISIAGHVAVLILSLRTMKRKERKILQAASSMRFDRIALKGLTDVLGKCAPDNRVYREDDEW